MHRRPAPGFTLIELLIVVAVIGVLAALILPAIGMARERANRVACASSLRQWGMALQAYASDHHDRLPRTPGVDQPAASIWNWDQPKGWPTHFYDQMCLTKMVPYLEGGARFDRKTRTWRLDERYVCKSTGRDRATSWNNTGSAFMTYAYYSWVDRWHVWTRSDQALATLTTSYGGLEPGRLIMGDMVVDKRDHGSQKRDGIWTNHGAVPGGWQAIGDLAGTNQLWGDLHVEWKGRGDFDLAGIEAKTATDWIFGWGDRYWF